MATFTLHEYQTERRENAERLAEYLTWLERLVGYGADYRRFSSAQSTHTQLRKALNEARKIRLG